MATRKEVSDTKKAETTSDTTEPHVENINLKKEATETAGNEKVLLNIGDSEHFIYAVNSVGTNGKLRGLEDADGDYIKTEICMMPGNADILIFIRQIGTEETKKLLKKVLRHIELEENTVEMDVPPPKTYEELFIFLFSEQLARLGTENISKYLKNGLIELDNFEKGIDAYTAKLKGSCGAENSNNLKFFTDSFEAMKQDSKKVDRQEFLILLAKYWSDHYEIAATRSEVA